MTVFSLACEAPVARHYTAMDIPVGRCGNPGSLRKGTLKPFGTVICDSCWDQRTALYRFLGKW